MLSKTKMKKLKVLISAYACNPRGTIHPGEDITGWNLVQQISRFHNTWVITHSYNKEEIRKFAARSSLNIKFRFVSLPCFRLLYKLEFGQRIYYYFWQILAFLVAWQLHHRIKFDLIHHITFNNDWVPSFMGALLPIPFIWGPMGGGQRTPKGFKGGYSLYGHIFDIVRIITQWLGRHDYFRRRCLKRAKAILVCNQETKDKIPKKYANKVHFFPVNGVSLEDFMISEKKESDRSFRILTAGRLVHWKAFDLAIRIFDLFQKKIGESELIIVGDGPEKSRLRRLVQHLGLQHKVHFISWLPRREVLSMMSSCDVFLYTSLREGGGAVIVEAMANGVPVVCLDIAGPGFHIQQGWGIKVAPKSPEYVITEMARALEQIYKDKALRIKLGKAARKRAKEFYLWDRLGEKMQEIYEKALST